MFFGPQHPSVAGSAEPPAEPVVGYLEPADVRTVLAVVDDALARTPRRNLFESNEVMDMLLDIRAALLPRRRN